MALSRSEFEDELERFVGTLGYLRMSISNLSVLVKDRDVPRFFDALGNTSLFLGNAVDFLDRYESFLTVLDTKFGLDTGQLAKFAKSKLGSVRSSLSQLKTFVAGKKFESADKEMESLSETVNDLVGGASALISVPAKIDYSRLDPKDWKMIGIPGVHYKSRVFLSYKWRDNNPTKDENESLMGNFVKPLLELLGIVPVTFRDNSLPQDPIDDKAIQLISNCNGVVAFYTKGDPISNVEHEIAQNQNLIAICNEEGSSGPSMRRARLQIDFSRDDMTAVMLGLIRALREDGLFRLKV
jgi:hypothetical protein